MLIGCHFPSVTSVFGSEDRRKIDSRPLPTTIICTHRSFESPEFTP
jgi:hypothetical protein